MANSKLQIVIEAQNKALGALNETTKQLEALGKSSTMAQTGLSSLSSSQSSVSVGTIALGSALGGVLAQGLNSVISGFLNLPKAMVMAAGQFEQTQMAFTTMMGSAEQANTLLRDLSDFAMSTPFTITGLEQSAKQLMAFGIGADEMVDTLRMIGDVAAGTGVPLDRIAYNYGQVRTANRMMGDDLRQFTMAGVPMLATLADQFGVTTGEIRDMVSEGKIGFKEMEDAFKTMTGEGGKFHDMMVAQSQTLLGRISNVDDAWTRFLRAQGSGLIMFVNMAVDGLYKILNWLIKDAEGFNYVGKSIYGVIMYFKALGTTVWEIAKVMSEFLAIGIGTFLNMGKSVVAFAKDFINAFKNIKTIGLSVFSAFAKAITGDFSGAADTIKSSFNDTFSNTISNGEQFSSVVGIHLGNIGTSMGKIGSAWGDFATLRGMDTTLTKFGTLGETIRKDVSAPLDDAKGKADKVAETFGKLQDKMLETMTNGANAIESVREKIQKLNEDLQKAFVENVKENLAINQGLAGAYVTQEEKIGKIKEELAKKEEELNAAKIEKVDGDNLKSHNEKIDKLTNEQGALQTKLTAEQALLASHSTILIAYENEVEEVRRRNSLSDFERAIEDLNLKRTIVSQELEMKVKKINDELNLEEQKQIKLIELQKYGIAMADKFLATQEKQTVDSINRQIETYNKLAKSISAAQQGKVSAYVGVSKSTSERMNQSIAGVNITINGDVSGQELINKVKSGIMGELSLNNKLGG